MHVLSSIKAFLIEPGLIKTPTLTGFAWLTWEYVEPALKGFVLIVTVIILAMQFTNMLARQWCPKRRNAGPCETCRLWKTVWCPMGLPTRKNDV